MECTKIKQQKSPEPSNFIVTLSIKKYLKRIYNPRLAWVSKNIFLSLRNLGTDFTLLCLIASLWGSVSLSLLKLGILC